MGKAIKNIEGLSVQEIENLVQRGGKFVVFPYTVSYVVATSKAHSSIYFIRPGENSIKYSYKHVLVNLIGGWWGIPWGPIYTLGAIGSHISGGKNLTHAVLSELRQNDPNANTSTYNINGTITSNQSNSNNNQGTSQYNVPR